MGVNSEIKDLILQGGTTPDIKRAALRNGMKTLRMSALTKVAKGETSLEEALLKTADDH